MRVIEYKYFDVILFDHTNDVTNRDDIIIANDIDSFVNQLRHIPIKKLDYLNYWHITEHHREGVIETYDEIISNMHEIEHLFEKNKEYKTFVLRMKNTQINYLRESDLNVEFDKIKQSILKRIDENEIEFNNKFNTKLDSLYKRTEIVISRISEYCHQKNLNPNLKIQNKIGYSLSDIRVD